VRRETRGFVDNEDAVHGKRVALLIGRLGFTPHSGRDPISLVSSGFALRGIFV
jgi:hypothetical protein